MPPKVNIRAMRIAPIARVLARSVRVRLPPARRSAMIPDPATVATRKAVPRNSAVAVADNPPEQHLICCGAFTVGCSF